MPECIDTAPNQPAAVVLVPDAEVEWTLRSADGQARWDWSTSRPDVQALRPVRGPKSSARSRHVPVWAYCKTTSDHLRLESGLEHDLLREVDRRRDVSWIVPQPVRLRFPVKRGGRRVGHTPDLLTVDPHGRVTVWDVRAVARQDEDFKLKSRLTLDACGQVGWEYRIFTGVGEVRRHNLMWLHGYRRQQPWYAASTHHLRDLLERGGCIGDVLAVDSGAGHLISAMWHSSWVGDLECDLDFPFTEQTEIRFAEPGHVT